LYHTPVEVSSTRMYTNSVRGGPEKGQCQGILNFGKRKESGKLFTSSSKSFQNLRKFIMPKIQQVMLDVLDKKHHDDWFSILEHLVQLTVQQQSQTSHSASKSSEASIARKKLHVDEFTDLLIVKKSAELYLHASSLQERDKLCQLFIGSLTLPETNSLLDTTASRLTHESREGEEDSLRVVAGNDSRITATSNVVSDSAEARCTPHINTNIASHLASVLESSVTTSRSRSSVENFSISKARWNKVKKSLQGVGTISLASSHSGEGTVVSSTLREVPSNQKVSTTLEIADFPVRSVTSSSESTFLSSSNRGTPIDLRGNKRGRLGLTTEAFANTALIRQISKAYTSAPYKEIKEILLSLCVGTFTRKEVNTYVVKPISPGHRRTFDRVSKMWWREIRRLAEQDASTEPLYANRITQIRPMKRPRTCESTGDDESHNERSMTAFDANSPPDLQTVRNVFLQGGLSLLSNSYTSRDADRRPQQYATTLSQRTRIESSYDMIDSDAIDGMLIMQHQSHGNASGGVSNNQIKYCGNSGLTSVAADDDDDDDDDSDDDDDEEDDCGSLGAYCEEDEANFDFE